MRRPQLHYSDILEWADEHRARTGTFPTKKSSWVEGHPNENWANLDVSLRRGLRGLPGGASLLQLLVLRRGVTSRARRPPLSVDQILTWADEHRARTGKFPTSDSGWVEGHPDEKWANLDEALRRGLRGLPGGASLLQLLVDKRGAKSRTHRPPLSVNQILAWADGHNARAGRFPSMDSGAVEGHPNEKWVNLDKSLRIGTRGLPGGSSLARLLVKLRGHRIRSRLPNLTLTEILEWADAHYRLTGDWPNTKSGEIRGVTGETWLRVNMALRSGQRGLPVRLTLAQLLFKQRGVRKRTNRTPLSIQRILQWAAAHRARTGAWPRQTDGSIPESPGDTWSAVDAALKYGCRGLSKGTSLSRLLARRRGARGHVSKERLSIKQILAWADEHRARSGRWPIVSDGTVRGVVGESWLRIQHALERGTRGLSGGSSLSRLLAKYRDVRNTRELPKHTLSQILRWADAHHKRMGEWPKCNSGNLSDAPGENWHAINEALIHGRRGLPRGSSLAKLLAERRGIPKRRAAPTLSLQSILRWADEFYARTGRWPLKNSGSIPSAPHETWMAVQSALASGHRGLEGGSSLPKLLAKQRGVRNRRDLPKLQSATIKTWILKYYRRHRNYPTLKAGLIPNSKGETWGAVNSALRIGRRGLPGGSSLAQLIRTLNAVPLLCSDIS